MPVSIRSNISGRSTATDFTLPGAVLVTKRDVAASLQAYEDLLRASKQFRLAMQAASKATCDFAVALEECARQKGASTSGGQRAGMADSQQFTATTAPGTSLDGRESPEEDDESPPSERLMAASGLHHLLGNHQQILADSVYRQFEVPLLDEFDSHRAVVAERQLAYEQATLAKTKLIRETEAKNIKSGRKKQRDLAQFRQALAELQQHVDDLDQLKLEHYGEVLENEQEMWDSIANKTAVVVKTELEVYDRIVTKGSVDPILEAMQQANPDPFGAYTPQQEDPSTIFSVLPTTSILSTLTNGSPRQTPTRSNSLATITPSPLAGPSTSTTSATTAAAAAEVSTSTAQAEPSKASNKKDQWSTSLAAISEYAKANGNGDAATEIGGDHLTESSGEGKTESEEGQSRSARSSSGPPVEGGSNTWAS